MVDPVVASKICVFLCFNVLYLISVGWHVLHAVVLYMVKSQADLKVSSSTIISVISLNCLIATIVLLVSVLGFIAFCTDKPSLFQTVSQFESESPIV